MTKLEKEERLTSLIDSAEMVNYRMQNRLHEGTIQMDLAYRIMMHSLNLFENMKRFNELDPEEDARLESVSFSFNDHLMRINEYFER